MELLLLQIFSILRPPTLMDVGLNVLGMKMFDLAGVALIGILVISIFIHLGLGKKIQWTAVDLLIVLYVLWCIGISIIYPDKTEPRDLVKWVSAFMTYLVAKTVIETHDDYAKIILLFLLGLSVPILISSIMIHLDLPSALDKEYYATKLKLYKGAYDNCANMAYSAFLYIVLALIYYRIVKLYPQKNEQRLNKIRIITYLLFIPSVLYCLIQSASRTAILGLIIFLFLYLITFARRALLALVIAMFGALILFSGSIKVLFMDVVDVYEGQRPLERIGSGRPYVWIHNLSEYSKMSVDRKIAGSGIGNRIPVLTISRNGESFWPSHNDFLAVFIQTGVVGFLIFLLLQLAIFIRIKGMEGGERSVFMAFFLATMAMNFASNSFVSQFGLSQIYFVIIAYIDAVPKYKNHVDYH